MEFDECYKTWDFGDKYNALSFPLIYHILSPTILLFLARYFGPRLLTFLSRSTFLTFLPLAVNSLHLSGEARERAV